jgi:hypothetical protein
MNSLGGLSFEMMADLSRLKRDMDQARGMVGGAVDSIKGAFSGLNGALAGLGLGLSAAGLMGWVKSAINAADETSKLAQRMGVTADQVAGLKLSFELGGSSAEGMMTAVSRLSRGMGEGSKALDAMGINAKNADGTLRGTRDVLGEVADKFAGYEDGAAKSALAQELFGRTGAELLPVLNAGSQGLDDMDAMAKKLGLTISAETGKKAEQFNDTLDLMGRAGQGVATQMAAELLPTLNGMAGALFGTVTEGERMARVAAVLGAGLKSLFTVGAIGVEVFNTLGKAIGATVGAIVSVAQGEFRQASRILEEGGRDIAAGWGDTVRTIEDAWNGAGAAAVSTLASIGRAQAPVTAGSKDLAAAQKAIAEAMKERRLMADRDLRALAEYEKREQAITEALERQTQAELQLQAARDLRRMAAYDRAEEEAEAAYRATLDADLRAREKMQADWDQTSRQIGQSLADSLMQGGKSAADYIKDLFRTMVLKPVLEAGMQPVADFMQGIMGGGAGGMGGQAGGLAGASALGPAAAAYLLGRQLGQQLSGGFAVSGSGNSLTNRFGVAGGAMNRLFGRRVADVGVEGTFSGGGGFSGQGFEFQKGGFLRSDKTVATALDPELAAVLGSGALAVSAQAQAYARALGLPVQAMLGVSQSIKLSLKDLSPEQIEDAIREVLGTFGNSLAATFADQLQPFQRAGEELAQTLQRLADLQVFSANLNQLGGVFSRLAGLSVTAREHMIELAGGMDVLGQRALQFVQDFYNRDEIAGLKASEIQAALAGVGLGGATLNTRDDFRALVEGADVTTAAGREQLDTLLRLAGGYAQLTDYLAETGRSLSGTAALAPQTGVVPDLFAGGQQAQVDAINNVSNGVERVYGAIERLIDITRGGIIRTPTWEVAQP